MIEFKNVYKEYSDGTEALKDFSLKINKGEIVTLIGPSGCGKTTTMKMINRLIEPTSGTLYINDKDINDYHMDELRWNIGYVLQQIALFPHMTIEENIAVVPEMKKWSKSDISKRTSELLEMVGLDPSVYKNRMPRELSGGQQQRVGVIRALAADPDIILMDEPFSALDPISRDQLQNDIKKLQQEIKKTIVFVTHDMDEALKLGDRVCLMKEGRLVQVDQPKQLILNPKNEFVQDFIGNRKSPWQIAVGEIPVNNNHGNIISSTYDTIAVPGSGTFILVDENKRIVNMVQNGKIIDYVCIEQKTPLYQAVEQIEESDQVLFPIIEQDHVVGTITHKEIVAFLRNRTDMENGVFLK